MVGLSSDDGRDRFIRMNAIPDFQVLQGYEYEVLPDGVYSCDEATFYDRFVEQMPESTTRERIYGGFVRLRAESHLRGSARGSGL